MVACCAKVPNLLTSTCGLLLVPSHILPEYLPCLEKVVRELSLHNLECSMITLKVLLESKCSSADLLNSADNLWQDHLLVNNNGYQSTCELLYQICEYQVKFQFMIQKTISLFPRYFHMLANLATIKKC